ncbi:MAG: IclR family transcriptional regulator C-terminal domain-containing protein, partial [Chloroflexi bacterium]|nr:IclR family transcriptional regulator C-terminal domain-containing protein [Chloroflexota bacterium]
MRRWWSDALAAADVVAGRADLWLPGALAWSLTVGWAPLTLAVVPAPDAADLTFLGARLYTSGAWPWNAFAAGVGLVLLAYADPELQEQVLAAPLKRYTARTMCQPDEVRRALAEVRRTGVAVSDGQIELIALSIAAPVRGPR